MRKRHHCLCMAGLWLATSTMCQSPGLQSIPLKISETLQHCDIRLYDLSNSHKKNVSYTKIITYSDHSVNDVLYMYIQMLWKVVQVYKVKNETLGLSCIRKHVALKNVAFFFAKCYCDNLSANINFVEDDHYNKLTGWSNSLKTLKNRKYPPWSLNPAAVGSDKL